MKNARTTLGLLGAALIGGMALGSNAFAVEPLSQGYQLASAKTPGEGKCGEGKCGGSASTKGSKSEGSCGGTAKAGAEGKCGEGKCGGAGKAGAEGKCGDASH